jgi:hypothetical protein
MLDAGFSASSSAGDSDCLQNIQQLSKATGFFEGDKFLQRGWSPIFWPLERTRFLIGHRDVPRLEQIHDHAPVVETAQHRPSVRWPERTEIRATTRAPSTASGEPNTLLNEQIAKDHAAREDYFMNVYCCPYIIFGQGDWRCQTDMI